MRYNRASKFRRNCEGENESVRSRPGLKIYFFSFCLLLPPLFDTVDATVTVWLTSQKNQKILKRFWQHRTRAIRNSCKRHSLNALLSNLAQLYYINYIFNFNCYQTSTYLTRKITYILNLAMQLLADRIQSSR